MRPSQQRSSRERGPRTAALAVLAGLTVAACGGPGSYNDAVGRSAPPGTELPVAGAKVPATAHPTNGAAFCQDVQQLQGLVSPLLQPTGAAAARQRAKALLARVQKDAPKEIRPAVQLLAQLDGRLSADFYSRPPDLVDVGRVLTDPVYQSSLAQVIAYAGAHC